MLRYAITDRALYPGSERTALLRQSYRWIADGIDFIQLREKDLPDAALARLSREILEMIGLTASSTKLLINSNVNIAIATGAHGVHLTSTPGEVIPAMVRHLYASAKLPAPILTVSCHTLDEVRRARENQINAILFAPVFEKVTLGQKIVPGQGLDQLRTACVAASPVPVYALGGVTFENAPSCIEAGAAGIAGIRLFHNG
jgi:thiamine-phosphate diphosphorylase